MQTVEEPIETIHVYVVKEKEKKPFVFLPLFAAVLCLASIVGVTIYSALNPSYEHETLILPAQFLPLQTFSATEPIIPTGVTTYPATFAHGTLTLTNGSVLTEQLPPGMIFSSQRSEVVTDKAVTVPPGSADGYGIATVSAHALSRGSQGNIQAFAINQVSGTSLFIRNLHAFTGGKDAYSVKGITSQDRQHALENARLSLNAQIAQIQAIAAQPCSESVSWSQEVHLTSTCQFIAYPHIPGKIIVVRLRGSKLLIDVVFVVRPKTLVRK